VVGKQLQRTSYHILRNAAYEQRIGYILKLAGGGWLQVLAPVLALRRIIP